MRTAPLAMSGDDFRLIGHELVDRIAEHLATLPERPVTRDEPPSEVRKALGSDEPLPDAGIDPGLALTEATRLLFDHSLFNGHPRFLGYITSSPAPLGMLGDFLAAAANQNMGAWKLSPMATEIEAQTVRWIAELIGFPADCGGLLVSGGNMANFVCFLAARTAKASSDVRKAGLRGAPDLAVYASTETHTWIQKATDLFGLGTDAIRWIPVDDRQQMIPSALRRQIEEDRQRGARPFLVVGTAGSVSTGAVDPLPQLAEICREFDLWFHVDGAYGGLAAQVPGAPDALRGLSQADSVAVDPHKWLYAPLEAGCVLVRRAGDLRNTFSYRPAYYHFDDQVVNYFDYGPQNSRGFRALKVWLGLRQAGRSGYLKMMTDDMMLARHLHKLMTGHSDFQALSQSLSISTFRYVPGDLRSQLGSAGIETYLNQLNQDLLTRVEKSGEAFLSNAIIGNVFALRACIVNFNTSIEDVEALPGLLARLGKEADQTLRTVRT
ncbi:MAG TPA: aminotransferase class V-fold PLP-dependent enzyme [Vicinamibacterales bacterium]